MQGNQSVAIVGAGAILPDAPDVQTFWTNIKNSRYSITEVPADRWDPELYWDPDPAAVDKTYSKIGAWVTDFVFNPFQWGIAIPPRVTAVMDEAQKFAVAAAYQALSDYGYPRREMDPLRTAVILGNAMGGEMHYRTTLRIHFPDYAQALSQSGAFKQLPAEVQKQLLEGMREGIYARIPRISEDTMPGELGNIIAGRVANVFNFSGPNFVTDAACASSLAAIQSAMEGLNSYQFDTALTGGVDRNMGAESFVKFSKIGALSPDGSRPYADGANGFVMGEGAVVLLLKRLADAERDGDKIYAVIRSVAGSSDGKGKGITAPNPLGQQRAIERAWQAAGVSPTSAGLIEGHGTSTRVGDVAEITSLNAVLGQSGLPVGSIAIGSVKSNIGHLKSAAGGAGVLKTALALYEKALPPSANFTRPNSNIDFSHLPFYVNTSLQPWEKPAGEIRRAGVSSFGFGGTNFHLVMEEWVPGLLTEEKKIFPAACARETKEHALMQAAPQGISLLQPAEARALDVKAPQPYRGLLFLGAADREELRLALLRAIENARKGILPENQLPTAGQTAMAERLAIDFSDSSELIKRAEKALTGFQNDTQAGWQALTAHGVYRGGGGAGKVAFLFPGQGSQYVNMLRDLREVEPLVSETFREADEVMTPILGRPLTSYIYDEGDEASQKRAEEELRNTAITQPAVLTTNVALLRVMEKFGFRPDLVIGHSLGEYAALVAAGVLSFPEALRVVSARGQEMAKVSMEDNGCMAAVSAPLAQVESMLEKVNGYVVIANINSPLQCVIGGNTPAVEEAIALFQSAGLQATKIPVSHAFHTRIVAPASEPLRRVIAGMDIHTPQLPIIANVTGEVYPNSREEILDILAQQVASPVQFIKGVNTLYKLGGRIFVEVGPKRVLNALVMDIMKDRSDVTLLATNHPRKGGIPSFNEALCGLYAAGAVVNLPQSHPAVPESGPKPVQFAASRPAKTQAGDGRLPLTGSVVISGAGLGLPGTGKAVFAEDNIQRILNGEIFIEPVTDRARQMMVDKRPVRLVKSDAGAVIEAIDTPQQVIQLAGRGGSFDLVQEFGVSAERAESTDISTQMAIAAGIDALRDAGIPLVMNYKKTSKGTMLPNRWMLPEALADETGVIFASAFPGLDRMAENAAAYYEQDHLKREIAELENLLGLIPPGQAEACAALENRLADIKKELAGLDYHFNRKFVFQVLSMGHSQFAEHIGARGPNTHVNAACASTTQAVALAEDWIRAGRCRRVVVISGDDVTRDNLMQWIGTGLFVSGAATTAGDLRRAVLPFDRRRNGMVIGMGAAAMVVESEDALRERGMTGICEILASQTANSAFHGTRLDVEHVSKIMEQLVRQAEDRFGISRDVIAAQTVFVSHETYTPARGGSAAAEIHALRATFGEQANRVVIANTKGYTGHAMGVGIEDVVAVKALETGAVPPIANLDDHFEPDPELGDLNLSHGGKYPIRYALRLGAGFGSQIAMTLLRKIPCEGDRIRRPDYERWLANASGMETPELEVVQHTLRVRNTGQPARIPARSSWSFGQGPSLWADSPDGLTPPAEENRAAAAAATPAGETSGGMAVPPAEKPGQNTAEPAIAILDESEIKAYVLEVVSEKTGYPAEMLDLDLDLEADLGVDTVKQAELFAVVRSHYGIPRREDLRLVDYNTLAKLIGFIQDNLRSAQAPTLAEPVCETQRVEDCAPVSSQIASLSVQGETASQPGGPLSSDTGAGYEEIKSYVLEVVSEKTGYPAEMLDLDLDLEADLGVDTVKQAELFATVRSHYGIPRREDLRLVDYNTLAKVIGFIQDNLGYAQPAAEKEPEPAVPVQETHAVPLPQEKPLEDRASAAPCPEPAAVAARGSDEEAIKAYVLAAVSEKTGYPVEMLDLDLDLEADLGVDTVKQAELFATIRSHFDIPRREDLRLVDYNTLAKVIRFMKESIDEKTAAETSSAAEAQAAAPEKENENGILREPDGQDGVSQPAGVIRRQVPIPVLRPRIDLCTPTSATLEAGWRVLVIGNSRISELLARRLRTRNVEALTLKMENPQELEKAVSGQLAMGPIQGVYFLAGLDVEPDLKDMTPKIWKTATRARVLSLAAVMKTLQESAFLVCGTRFGGLHGYTPQGASAPLGGAVSGLAKSLSRERPEMLVKVVDFEESAPDSLIASRLIEETLRDPAVVEVGWENEQRFTIVLSDQPEPVGQPAVALPENPVFLVSGGSGGITAPIIRDLAQRASGRFYLLGRTPLPAEDNPDLKRLQTDRKGLKQDLAARLALEGLKGTPVEVEGRLNQLERGAATLATMRAIEEAGGKAIYLTCDVADFSAVNRAVKEIRKKEGRVDVFLHAAGVERSRKLENKTLEEFETIFSVKADGFFHIYHAMQQNQCQPKAIIAFSSIAGRLGNAGQTDYAAANDLLSRVALAIRRQQPETQVLVIDWGAWAEVGMASRGNIPHLMEMAGIEMIRPAVAAPLVFKELAAGTTGEVVLAGATGVLSGQTASDGGLDISQANKALMEGKQTHTLFNRITGLDLNDGVILEADLDPQTELFLRDHSMNGIPLLPGVMGIEGFSAAARHISSVLGSAHGSFQVSRMEDIRFLAPFKFYRGESRRITWKAQAVHTGTELMVKVRLESSLATRVKKAERLLHFSGNVFMTASGEPLEKAAIKPPLWNGRTTIQASQIYRLYFHGPSFQVLEGVQRSEDGVIGKLQPNLPSLSGDRVTFLTKPALVELCLQTAGIWEIGRTGVLALPGSIGSLKFYEVRSNGTDIYAQVQPREDDGKARFDAQVVDARGHIYLELKDYRTSPLPYPVETDLLRPLAGLVD